MEIRIASYVAASHLLETEPGRWHALVLLDSGMELSDLVMERTRSYHCLRFNDVIDPRDGRHPPTRSMIEEGQAFAAGKDRLLVTCRAGQSRSAAMAYVIGARALGPAEGVKLLDPKRHSPNQLVVAIAAEEHPEIAAALDEWRRLHSDIRLADYYDEIERELQALEALGVTNRICHPSTL